MIIKECYDLVNSYVEWLKTRISVENIDGICEITTPFLDRHNDHLQIYVKHSDNGLLLTDDGYTINDLRIGGCDFSTEKRKQTLNSVLNGFGVKLFKDEIIIEARPDNFPQKKHNLLQAILAVNDLFVMASPTVASFFREDVERYLSLNEIRYTPSVKFTGKSGFDHSFDFVIPASRKKPERILKTINRPNKQSITLLIFSWTDTKEIRAHGSSIYGILNDTEQQVNPELTSALRQYGINSMLWSLKDKYIQELAS